MLAVEQRKFTSSGVMTSVPQVCAFPHFPPTPTHVKFVVTWSAPLDDETNRQTIDYHGRI
jgi:hypothetical protein